MAGRRPHGLRVVQENAVADDGTEIDEDGAGGAHNGSRYKLPIRDGLIDQKHRRAMGNAVWLYLYLHAHAGFSTGVVRHYQHTAAAAELGISVMTVKRQMERLKAAGYVRTRRVNQGSRVEIVRYAWPRDAEQRIRNDTSNVSEMIPSEGSNVSLLVRGEPSNVSLLMQQSNTGDTLSSTVRSLSIGTDPTSTASPQIQPQAVTLIATALVQARGSTVEFEQRAGRWVGMCAEVTTHLVTPLATDRRGITAETVARCIGYLRTKPFFRGDIGRLTARRVSEDLGGWLQAGMPERYEERSPPPRRDARAGPAAQGPPRRAPGEGPVRCACGSVEWARHSAECRYGGPVKYDHYIPPGQDWRRKPPAGPGKGQPRT